MGTADFRSLVFETPQRISMKFGINNCLAWPHTQIHATTWVSGWTRELSWFFLLFTLFLESRPVCILWRILTIYRVQQKVAPKVFLPFCQLRSEFCQ